MTDSTNEIFPYVFASLDFIGAGTSNRSRKKLKVSSFLILLAIPSLSGERMPTKGSDRWKPTDTACLCEHFEQGEANPMEQSTCYIGAFFDKTKWLQERTTKKRLYQNYCRHAATWLSEQEANGS